MRWSQNFIHTLRQDPSDAEVVSHRLMTRAGFISKLAAGIYNYLPLGWRSLTKLQNIIREEMERAGSAELVLPAVQPAELWEESGTVVRVWARTAADQGPPRTRLLFRPHPRGGDHRYRPPHHHLLPPTAGQPLSDPDQVPGRDPAALRTHARPRVHHEGRLHLPRRSRRPRSGLPSDGSRLLPGLRAVRTRLHTG